MESSLIQKYTKICGVVALYWCISISLVFVNKSLLKGDELKLDAPLFVTFFQCVCTVIMCKLCDMAARKFPDKMSFPSTVIETQKCKDVLPLSVVFVAMIAFNNLCLQEVGVAFYTVARSLVTIFSLVFTYLILGKKTSLTAILCCGIIVGGFILGVNQEGDLGSLSVIGTSYGVIASACVALNSIYTKKILPKVDQDIWRLTYYNNINACFIFIPLMVMNGEIGTLANFPFLYSSKFWVPMSVAGAFGFSMGYVVGLQIQVTSPITHNISGVAKACCQTVFAVLLFSEVKTVLWWLSNFLVLTGTGSYALVKSMEMKKVHEAQQSAASKESDKKPLIEEETDSEA